LKKFNFHIVWLLTGFVGLFMTFPSDTKAQAVGSDWTMGKVDEYRFSDSIAASKWFVSDNTYVKDGRYHLDNNDYFWVTKGGIYQNIVYRAKIDWISGTNNKGYGLIIRKSESGYYQFNISANGYVRFMLKHNNQWRAIKPWTKFEPINQRGLNELEVQTIGSTFHCFVNRKFAFTVTDSSLTKGNFGLLINDSMHVAISYLSITPLFPPEPVATPVSESDPATQELSAIAMMDSAYWHIRNENWDKAMSFYEMAIDQYPDFAPSYYGKALVYEYQTFKEGKDWLLGNAVDFYRLYLSKTDPGVGQYNKVKEKVARLEYIRNHINESDKISHTKTAGWPYGMPGVTIGLGFSMTTLMDNNNDFRTWKLQAKVPKTYFNMPDYCISVRVLKKWSVGASIVSMSGPVAKGDPDLEKSSLRTNLWSMNARYSPVAWHSSTEEFDEFYLEFGYGGASITGTNVDHSEGNAFHFRTGLNMHYNTFGFALFTGFQFTNDIGLYDSLDQPIMSSGRQVTVKASGWQILGMQLLIAF